MKIRLHHIVILSFMAVMAVTDKAYGQEYHMRPDSETPDGDGDKIDREKIMYSPGEADTRYNPTPSSKVKSDSIAATSVLPPVKVKIEKQPPTTKPTVGKQSKEEDESILSFNFLYYIIQKYKLQDIVD